MSTLFLRILFTNVLLILKLCDATDIIATEVFVIPINPSLFNWTLQDSSNMFSYSSSLKNSPDLPPWIHYSHRKSNHTGYLYGVPPMHQNDISLDIIGLNRKSYETRYKSLNLNVHDKPGPAKYEVQLKIDNLNVEDMFDTHRRNRLLEVFTHNLWIESKGDLYVTFLESAVQLGARLPLSPNEREGVVLKLGSQAEFSLALIELQEEVKPLWKLTSCPRDFKRTSVDRFFREEGFALDWCTFKLVMTEDMTTLQHFSRNEPDIIDYYTSYGLGSDSIWSRPSKDQVPQRSYVSEFVFTILVPMLVMIVLVLILSLILCFHHEGMDDVSDEYFESLFSIFEEPIRSKRNKEMPAVQMVQYTAVHRATNILRSLSNQREPSTLPSEQNSTTVSRSRTTSPNSSLPRSSIPRTSAENNSYCRPNPPPYAAIHRGFLNRSDF